MKNLKKLSAIFLAILGIGTFSTSCQKSVECKCDLEDENSIDVYITIQKGNCEDVYGEFEYDGYSYDIEDCRER